jgi:hypothetical protein
MFIPVGATHKESRWLYRLDSISRERHVAVKQSMLQSLMSLWKANPCHNFVYLVETGHYQVIYSGAMGGEHASVVWPEDCSVYLFSGGIVLGQLLESVQMPLVVWRKDLLRESRIPGHGVRIQ